MQWSSWLIHGHVTYAHRHCHPAVMRTLHGKNPRPAVPFPCPVLIRGRTHLVALLQLLELAKGMAPPSCTSPLLQYTNRRTPRHATPRHATPHYTCVYLPLLPRLRLRRGAGCAACAGRAHQGVHGAAEGRGRRRSAAALQLALQVPGPGLAWPGPARPCLGYLPWQAGQAGFVAVPRRRDRGWGHAFHAWIAAAQAEA